MNDLKVRINRIAEIVVAEENGNIIGYKEFCDYVKSQSGKMKHFRKNVKVRAWQADGSEDIHNELENTDYKDIKPGSWIVSNVANKGEVQVVDDAKFRKRYDIESFEKASDAKNDTDGFYMATGEYFGTPYDGHWGENVTVDMSPSWGSGSKADLTMSHYIGAGDDGFNDCYPIEKNALNKTYVVVASSRFDRIAMIVASASEDETYESKINGLIEKGIDIVSEEMKHCEDRHDYLGESACRDGFEKIKKILVALSKSISSANIAEKSDLIQKAKKEVMDVNVKNLFGRHGYEKEYSEIVEAFEEWAKDSDSEYSESF